MTTPNLEQIDQFAEIAWRKACDRARAAEGNSPTTAKWEDVVTQDEWRSMVSRGNNSPTTSAPHS